MRLRVIVYARKHAEPTKHRHKRAPVMTARRSVGLVVGLLHRNEPYSTGRTDKPNPTSASADQPLTILNGKVRATVESVGRIDGDTLRNQ